MSSYGPRPDTAPVDGVATGSTKAGAGFEVVNGSTGVGAVPAVSRNGELGRASSQQSVSSGINSFGPSHEERASLG